MEAKDFVAWLEKEGLNTSKASRLLGLARNTIDKYKEEGAPAHIAYACAAISFGLPPWRAVE